MEYRKRHLMLHKFALSTLVKMAIAAKKSRPLSQDKINDRNILNALAVEAITLLKKTDTPLFKKTEETKTSVNSEDEYQIF